VTEHLQYFEDKEQFRVNLTLQMSIWPYKCCFEHWHNFSTR